MSEVMFVTMRRWMLGLMLVATMLGWVVAAQADYYDGLRAADTGRHSEALREWQAAVNAGDAKAMLALGRLYRQGLGAPQDYIKAHMWFNLAAGRGEAEAVTERDALAGRMAPEQIAEAQKLAAAWQPGATQPAKTPIAGGSAGPPPPKAIREAQELLAALGYEPDPPDGQWGERTAQAYQAFVRDANLPATDTLTPTALKAMRAKARQAGVVSTPLPKGSLPPDALHRAAKAGNLKMLEAALAAGADVNARDRKGWTALMCVVDKGYALLVEPLLQAKADPDVRTPDGATALFMAVAHGHSEIIAMLMQAGADPMIEGPKGKTATELAEVRYDINESLKAFNALKALKKDTKKVIAALLLGMTLDDFAFHRARLQRTPEAYAEYVASYPSGRHLEKVHRLQTELSQPPHLLTVTSPAGTTARECAKCPEMVVVPAGRFLMGASSRGEVNSESDLVDFDYRSAQPVHEVTIDYKFAVGKYQVTLAEWDTCVAAGGCTNRLDKEVSGINVARGTMRDGTLSPKDSELASFDIVHNPGIYPAFVSWDDAQEYVRWLSRETGKPYRLLSEAEWEYAARAGTTTKYSWGNSAPQIRERDWESYFTQRGVYQYPVGHFEPNPFGLFDMEPKLKIKTLVHVKSLFGAEWVEDCMSWTYEGAPSDGSAMTDDGWFSGNDCNHRMVRGKGSPRFRHFDIRAISQSHGFRCARTLD
ncbi:MAG: SUMF1/EgtB/PvdO family nonheme iron enzyme [Candidatus Tectomicrobia bacterium]|nr:SUMF1/EgtB/PvdO family nonheme iron enzyme [Candidatus Tectomicrobia bacterium]